ncbi:hypothetical protein [Pseudoclavibacter sp. AY1F1]|uniref:hypothetical protein n=1 Tax=Pseudoclavibacter sp. AY1F1 TaxID=2080583 RepID=UPI0011B056FC|nr:hypothetical protein [Pseudoclavibacter sp. AY1F1]
MDTQGASLITWSSLRWASGRATVMAGTLLAALALLAWLVGGTVVDVLRDTLGWWLAGFGAAALVCAVVTEIAMWWMRGGSRWGYFASDEAKLDYLESVMRLCPSDARLVRVGRLDGAYPTGSRCAVKDVDGDESSSWFAEAWPTRGDVLLVRGAYGHGHHWGDSNVLYVNEVLTRLPSWVWGALRRSARREAREARQWQRAERREQEELARDAKYAVQIPEAAPIPGADFTERDAPRVEFAPTEHDETRPWPAVQFCPTLALIPEVEPSSDRPWLRGRPLS